MMSELISGKDALIALVKGDVVQLDCGIGWCDIDDWQEWDIKQFTVNVGEYKFRLKPKTITLNSIEIPAPFEPKDGDSFWHIYPAHSTGYHAEIMQSTKHDSLYSQFGAWRTEDEIKQVVSALRSIFNP